MPSRPSKRYGIRRIWFLFFSILSVFILFLCFLLIHESQRSLLDYTLMHAQKNCELLQSSLNQATIQIGSAFLTLQYDTNFRQIMTATNYSTLSPEVVEEFKSLLAVKANLPPNSTLSFSTNLLNYSDIYLVDELMKLNEALPPDHGVLPLGVKSPSSPIVDKSYLVFGFNYFADGDHAGNVFISLNVATLMDTLPIVPQEGIYFILADNGGQITFLQDAALPTSTASSVTQLITQADADYSKWSVFQNPRFVYDSLDIRGLDCTIYAVIDSSIVTKSTDQLYYWTLSFLMGMILFSAVWSQLFQKTVVNPLVDFSRYIARLRNKQDILTHPSQPPILTDSCQEIQNIGQEFSALMGRVVSLSGEVRQKTEDIHNAEMLRKNIEIEQLRSQINPHFLYNTLELIRADAMAGKTDQVSAITASMGKFYRYSIKGSPMVPFRDELEHVRSYLSIQQERYDGRITILYNINAAAEDILVPKMILQPLVENAIVHGLEPAGGGTLLVSAKLENCEIVMSVRDDGVGMSSDQLAKIQSSLGQKGSSNSVGLVNVSSRLHLQYGDRCDFQISSTPGDGTCITISVPLAETEDAG